MTVRITQFIRDRRNQRRGLFDAIINRDSKEQVSLGWSLCSTTKGDRFNRELGLHVAEGRREKDKVLNFSVNCKESVEAARESIPHSMRETFDRVINRCDRIVNSENAVKETVS